MRSSRLSDAFPARSHEKSSVLRKAVPVILPFYRCFLWKRHGWTHAQLHRWYKWRRISLQCAFVLYWASPGGSAVYGCASPLRGKSGQSPLFHEVLHISLTLPSRANPLALHGARFPVKKTDCGPVVSGPQSVFLRRMRVYTAAGGANCTNFPETSIKSLASSVPGEFERKLVFCKTNDKI